MISDLKWEVDLVVPVPLSSQRFKQRGYNQAALLAKPIAMALRIPYSDSSLARIKETKSQVGLSLHDRRQNVHGVFAVHHARMANKRVLIVDDVTTTGATIEACALTLIEAGAGDVKGIHISQSGFRLRPCISLMCLHQAVRYNVIAKGIFLDRRKL